MFIGSFYRLQSKSDIDRKVPVGPMASVIYIEDEGKFYERNVYGVVTDYLIGVKEPVSMCKCIDHTDEISNMEGRIHDLELLVDQLNKIIGGSYEI